jgi:hypothetical protein
VVSSLACGSAGKATLNMEHREAVKIFLPYIFLSLFSLTVSDIVPGGPAIFYFWRKSSPSEFSTPRNFFCQLPLLKIPPYEKLLQSLKKS